MCNGMGRLWDNRLGVMMPVFCQRQPRFVTACWSCLLPSELYLCVLLLVELQGLLVA